MNGRKKMHKVENHLTIIGWIALLVAFYQGSEGFAQRALAFNSVALVAFVASITIRLKKFKQSREE